MQLLMSAGIIQPGGDQHGKLAGLAEVARTAQATRSAAPAAHGAPTPAK
jgi:hypothetical protein